MFIMRIARVLGVLGFLVLIAGLGILSSVPFSAYYNDPDVPHLFVSALVTITVGGLMMLPLRRKKIELGAREGFAIVALCWFVIPFFGSFPFLFSGQIPRMVDAYFESVSGFTTTGGSILSNVEVLSHGLLYWRSLTHWLGGMGIIVLSLAVLPMLGIGGMQLFKAEVAGPTKNKLTPRVAETARLLWGLYVILTVAQIVLLRVGGMPLFDSICHAFATISTGGFSTKNLSIAAYDSAYIDMVVTLFMFIGGTSFSLHFLALQGKVRQYRDQEFVFFTITAMVAIFVVAFAVVGKEYGGDILQALRYSAFNVMTVMSCTGFATADFALWSPLAQGVLFFLMFPGATSGSTGGGMKTVRVLLMLKAGTNLFKRLLHPKAVTPITFNGALVGMETMMAIAGFAMLYFVTFGTGTIVLTAAGSDILTSMSAVAANMANVGPGLAAVGPMANYGHLPDISKWTLDVCMILGRLEIYTVLVLFTKVFWRG
ncbi:MAG: TrkH family potassium uptake protein [Bacteroidota bacterium]